MGVYDYFHTKGHNVMLELDYPFTSGASGDATGECLYSSSKATDVGIKGSSFRNMDADL